MYIYLQYDQLNMAVFFCYLGKVTSPVSTCTVKYTEQVTFYKVPEKHGHVYLVTLYLMLINGCFYLKMEANPFFIAVYNCPRWPWSKSMCILFMYSVNISIQG